jgi:hypothetical protein
VLYQCYISVISVLYQCYISVISVFGGMKILKHGEIHLKVFVFMFHSFFLSHFHSPEWFVWRHWRNVFPPHPTVFPFCFWTFFPHRCVFHFTFLFVSNSTMDHAVSHRSVTGLSPVCHRSVTGLSPPRSAFLPRAVSLWFLLDKLALGQILLRVLPSYHLTGMNKNVA